MDISRISNFIFAPQDDPLYNPAASYLEKYKNNCLSQGLFKMLFCVLARHTITPADFYNLALSCKPARDACREFAAMKMYLFRRTIDLQESNPPRTIQIHFLPNGLAHGVFRDKVNWFGPGGDSVSHITFVENGKDVYEISHYNAIPSMFVSIHDYSYGIRKSERIAGRFLIKDDGDRVRYGIANEARYKLAIDRCYYCNSVTTLRVLETDKSTEIVYHRKCKGEFKWYSIDNTTRGNLPKSIKCSVIEYAIHTFENDLIERDLIPH